MVQSFNCFLKCDADAFCAPYVDDDAAAAAFRKEDGQGWLSLYSEREYTSNGFCRIRLRLQTSEFYGFCEVSQEIMNYCSLLKGLFFIGS